MSDETNIKARKTSLKSKLSRFKNFIDNVNKDELNDELGNS